MRWQAPWRARAVRSEQDAPSPENEAFPAVARASGSARGANRTTASGRKREGSGFREVVSRNHRGTAGSSRLCSALMPPELHGSIASRARALRAGLAPTSDLIAATTSARRLFDDAGDAVRVRWLNLELGGYEPAISTIGPLHRVLGVPPHDRLAAHVAAYRTQRGSRPGGPHLVHFFVEGLAELIVTRDRASSASGTQIELSFGPAAGSPDRAGDQRHGHRLRGRTRDPETSAGRVLDSIHALGDLCGTLSRPEGILPGIGAGWTSLS